MFLNTIFKNLLKTFRNFGIFYFDCILRQNKSLIADQFVLSIFNNNIERR